MRRLHKPIIDGFGDAWIVPDAALRFNPDLDHKVVFSVTQAPPDESRANPGLERVARFINLFAADVGNMKRLEVVVIGSGAATRAMLANDAHRNLSAQDNPNVPLLDALAAQGTRLYVCGQALAERDYQSSMIHPRVVIALSAMTVVVECQLRGFALLPY